MEAAVWDCPRCTLRNSQGTCMACGFRLSRMRARTAPTTRGSATSFASLALRATLAGAAGLLLGRASRSRSGTQQAAIAAITLVAVPAARYLVRCLAAGQPTAAVAVAYAPAGGTTSRERRRRQLLRAARRATEDASAAGAISATEQQLLELVTQPSMSRPERVRTIARVLEWLQQLEADTTPRSRSTQLVSALVVYELNALVDAMSYDELQEAFGGGHPPDKGLAQSQVEALPAVQLTVEAVAALSSTTCSVCLDELEVGETARLLPSCGHSYHAACLDRWLLKKAVCPVCRAVVVPGSGPAAGGGLEPPSAPTAAPATLTSAGAAAPAVPL